MNFRAVPSLIRAMPFKCRIILQTGVESIALAYHAPFISYYSGCILDNKNVTFLKWRSCFYPSASIQRCLHGRVSHHQRKRKYSALQSIVFWQTDTSIHQSQCLTLLVLSIWTQFFFLLRWKMVCEFWILSELFHLFEYKNIGSVLSSMKNVLGNLWNSQKASYPRDSHFFFQKTRRISWACLSLVCVLRVRGLTDKWLSLRLYVSLSTLPIVTSGTLWKDC